MTLPARRLSVVLVSVLLFAACSSTAPNSATVYFKTDAPLCSKLVIEKAIDGVTVGIDTMSNGQLSAAYVVSPGTHVVSGRVNFAGNANLPWYDTTVTLANGASFTRVLPFYCS